MRKPFYNIVLNISVRDNYISPYFNATCIQYNSAILFMSRLLACKYRFTGNLSLISLRRKNGMQYRLRCNIFNSFENALIFMNIYKGRLVKISALFYKKIYVKYLILYRRPSPPPKIGKNTKCPKIFAPPSARRNFFKCAP